MKVFVNAGLALCVMAGSLTAQVLETKTIELRHLRPAEAVKLLSPYVRSTGGGVFDVSEKIHIVTVRDVPENIALMEKVLAKYDHSPATIRLVFQLIEADTGNRLATGSARNPVGMDLDSTLRSVLKFPTYRLLAQGVATAGEFSNVGQQLANADKNSTYNLSADVGTIRLSGQASGAVVMRPVSRDSGVSVDENAVGTVHLLVRLSRNGTETTTQGGKPVTRIVNDFIISTGLDVPLGHMVVLGTAATKATGVALILTVKPELVNIRP